MINYDKEFNARINKVVRSFNAKVRRLENEGYKYLPDKVSVADLKTTYFDRDSLKRRLKQLERFTTRGAEEIVQLAKGAKVTKWELETLKSDMAYLKRAYNKKIESYGSTIPTILGERQVATYAQMGDPRYENLRVLRKSLDKDLSQLEQGDFNRVKRGVFAQIRRRERQKYILWANYFTFLEDVAYKAGIDDETLNRIKGKLLDMDIDKFIEFFETEKAFSSIIDYYDLQKIKSGGYSDKDIDTVKELFKGIDLVIDEYM